jgi:glycosyltransferase involved in cell wall biosynthesis
VSRPHEVQLVVPAGIDDPTRPSGGNSYDRRVGQGLDAAGWVVSTRAVAGGWPWPDAEARHRLCELFEGMAAGSLVLVDGLVASTVPEVLVPASERLRLAVLVHLPVGWQDARAATRALEAAVLGAAAAVVTTSEWSRRWLLATYGLDASRVHTAHPGVDLADPAPGTDAGGQLLCVGAVTPAKGYDVLLAALTEVADLPWRCLCVGTLALAPDFVGELRRALRAADLGERVVLTGPLTGRALEHRYAAADLLVLASRAETYGMVVTEALARALPVLAPDVGGVPEALGAAPDGRRPGLLLPPGDPLALADSLRRWLGDPKLRRCLRDVALARRDGLTGWSETARLIGRVLAGVAS